MTRVVRVHWGWVLTFVTLWCYGWSAACTRLGAADVLVSPLLAALSVATLWIALERVPATLDALEVSARDLLVFASYAALLPMLVWDELSAPIWEDEGHHAFKAFWQQANLIEALTATTDRLSNAAYRTLLIASGALLLAAGVGLAAVLLAARRFATRGRLVVCAAVFVGIVVFRDFVRYADAHPPLRLFPLWLSATLLTPSYLSFRLPSFVALVTCMVFLERRMAAALGVRGGTSWGFALAAGTMPVALQVATIVEQSIWTMVVWTMLACELVAHEWKDELPWIRWAALVTIGTLLRQPCVAAFGILAAALAVERLVRRRLPRRETLLLTGLAAAVCLPFLIKSFVSGTPSTGFTRSGGTFGALARGLGELANLNVFRRCVQSLGAPWAVLVAFAFVPRGRSTVPSALLLLTFFLGGAVMFAMVPTWGQGRYQGEYAAPFAIAGLYNLFLLARDRGWARKALTVGAFGLVAFDVAHHRSIYPAVPPDDATSLHDLLGPTLPDVPVVAQGRTYRPGELTVSGIRPRAFVDHRILDWKDAFAHVEAASIDPGAVLDLDSLYFPVNWILAGASARDVGSFIEANRRYGWQTMSGGDVAGMATNEARIRYVFCSSPEDVARFGAKGWKLDRIFADNRHRTALFLMVR